MILDAGREFSCKICPLALICAKGPYPLYYQRARCDKCQKNLFIIVFEEKAAIEDAFILFIFDAETKKKPYMLEDTPKEFFCPKGTARIINERWKCAKCNGPVQGL